VSVDIPPALLKKVANARAVSGTALGLPIILASEDLVAIGKFAEAVHLKVIPRK
jgi:hypothetical protein